MNKTPFPTVTIATVTYNAEKTLPCTMERVAAQTYPPIEHLIIAGCSKALTMALIHRYVDANTGKTCPHDIRVIREPDKGLYDAMNKALEHATGDYIVYAETDCVDGQGRFIRHRRLQAPKQLTWKKFRHGMLVCHQSFYVRTDLARQELYDLSFRFSADYDWCIRLLKRAERLKQPIYNTRLILTDYLSEGLTTQHHQESLRERFRIMASHFGWTTTLIQHGWFVIRAALKR